MSTQELRLTQHVDAPVETVWAVLTDIEDAAETLSGIVAVEQLTPGPYAVGLRWRETRKMFGMSASEEMEVAEVDAPHRTVVTSVQGEVTYRTVFALAPKPAGGTELVMLFSASQPPQRGLKRLVGAATSRLGTSAARRMMEQDLQDIAAAAAARA